MLDRWKISINDEERDKSEPVYKVTQNVPYNIINNYFSIGVVSDNNSSYLFPTDSNPRVRMPQSVASNSSSFSEIKLIHIIPLSPFERKTNVLIGYASELFASTSVWPKLLQRSVIKDLACSKVTFVF